MLISIDPGKYATKAISQTNRVYFPTRLSPNPTMDSAGNTYHVQFQNSEYLLGEQAEQSDFDISKTSLLHKLATYTGISQLQESDYNIQLALGCPLNIYKNKELRNTYKAYIMDNRFIHICINDISYSFYIENVLVLPESAGIVYLIPTLFKNKRTAVVDLGGLNMNFSIYDNYIPQVSSMFTLNLGGNELQNSILNTLNTRYGIVLNNQDIWHIMQQSGLKIKGKIDNESITLVNTIIEEYLQKILQAVRKNGYNLDTLDVCFVGGTSKLIEGMIRAKVLHAFIPEEPEWSNAEGFYKIGQIKYETI
jgi:plasmid segregation protein ParM